MRMAALAWDAVSPQTIQNCWVKAGILPNDVSWAAAFAELELENLDPEAELTKVLDQLESRGALQASNRITETEFLNPPDERVMGDAADSEIFAAVMQACENEQQSEINGGDDGDNEGPNKPLTTRPEALKAVSTLQSYIQSLDGPFARQLEASLARFGKETQRELTETMVSTAITDYFTSK
ncbi:unnamed protein product [Mycena citricolor]|uniref:DDE-1 domain-containing protein n=1 Tax=Mycena citricolor TaxID=2018698 RepID=A0AAD2H209_9AGAR|nr:unnamed protein product [Mycena citricolor]